MHGKTVKNKIKQTLFVSHFYAQKYLSDASSVRVQTHDKAWRHGNFRCMLTNWAENLLAFF